MTDISEIKAMLQDRIEQLCRELLPRGRREGRQWVSNNPVTNDWKHTPALKVGIVSDRGAWRCWRSGDAGDVLNLIAYLTGAHPKDMKHARAWAEDWLGIRRMSLADRRAMAQKAAAEAKQWQAKADADRERRVSAAFRKWQEGAAFGDLSPVEKHARRYWHARQCPIDDVENPDPNTFRFARQLEWWRGAQYRTEGRRKVKVKPGPAFPAILSAMRDRWGGYRALHATFLDSFHPKKAPVEPPKLMLGEAGGAVISLTLGPSRESPFTCQAPSPVVICEGIETGLTLAVALPEARVWAAGSLAGIGAAPVDLPSVGEIIFARDNNHGNAQAQRQFELALERLEASGKPVSVMASPVGDDFNDLAQAWSQPENDNA